MRIPMSGTDFSMDFHIHNFVTLMSTLYGGDFQLFHSIPGVEVGNAGYLADEFSQEVFEPLDFSSFVGGPELRTVVQSRLDDAVPQCPHDLFVSGEESSHQEPDVFPDICAHFVNVSTKC